MDYRRTKYCPELVDINEKKKRIEKLIKYDHPKAKDLHTYISDNSKMYKLQFIQAYSGKCAYCGVSVDLIQKNEFEIDHFLYEKAPKFKTKKEAGYIENLVLACHECNHNKSSFLIKDEYLDKLNPDRKEIKDIFIRDRQYYICINDLYKENYYIKKFYSKVRLGSELHRLDYLLMNIIGLQRKCQENEEMSSGLGKIMDVIRVKRNII
jgi:5-methylcytosine-specific restriction endonuclease McrA